MLNSRNLLPALHGTLLFRLIHSVVQGMQVAAMPTDPECATGKINQVSKIMRLGEENPHTRAAEALAKFEGHVKEEGNTYRFYQEIPKEQWGDGN